MASTYASLSIHVIFATDGRAPMIEARWREELHAYLVGAIELQGATPIRVGGVADHVHLLMGIRPMHCVADLVRDLKRSSSVWAQERFEGFKWQASYAVFSVGASQRSRVATYIAGQESHHAGVSSKDELRQLLADAGIEFDNRYFE